MKLDYPPGATPLDADELACLIPKHITTQGQLNECALECVLDDQCFADGQCPRGIENIDPAWGEQRIVNLMASWRNQLLEVMGAMGMREVRRIRGERGRAMLKSELDAELFAPIFG